jgi:hypothetical protein
MTCRRGEKKPLNTINNAKVTTLAQFSGMHVCRYTDPICSRRGNSEFVTQGDHAIRFQIPDASKANKAKERVSTAAEKIVILVRTAQDLRHCKRCILMHMMLHLSAR